MDEFGKELESEEKKLKGSVERTDYYHKKFYEKFTDEMIEYQSGGKLPINAAHDLKFLLECRQNKLESMNDELTEIYSASLLSDISETGFSDEKYNYKRLSKKYRRELQIYNKKDGRKFSKKDNIYFNENITFAKQGKINDDDKFCCPECGKISELKKLEQGCPECQKESFIIDIFPKVTNCFNVRNKSLTLVDFIKKLLICGLFGFASGIPVGAVMMISNMPAYLNKDIIMRVISDVFTAPFKGFIIGALAAIIWIFGQFIYFNAKKSPDIEKLKGIKKSLKTFMSKYDKNFNYDFFESKLIFLTQLIIYNDNREELPICKLEYPVRKFDIIDSVYNGIIELRKIKSEDDICTIELEINMSDIHDDGRKIFSRDDTFIIKLQKNISKAAEADFEIKKIVCQECGKCFDGWINQSCPSCGKEYNIENDDWVVKEFKLK